MYDDEQSESPEDRVCSSCSARAPATNTVYTLVSGKHKWRVRRRDGADGQAVFEWYCPSCWANVRES